MLDLMMIAGGLFGSWGSQPIPETPGLWEWFSDDRTTNTLLGIFTFLLVVSNFVIWWTAKKTTRTVERAYLSVEPQGIGPIADETRALVGIHNTGRLPARNVYLSTHIEAPHHGDRKDFPPTDDEHGSYIVPGGTVMIHGSDRMPATSIDKTTGKDLYCYVWGEVRYHDGFHGPRHTKFCHRYPINMAKPDGTIKKKYARFHNFGNEADEVASGWWRWLWLKLKAAKVDITSKR